MDKQNLIRGNNMDKYLKDAYHIIPVLMILIAIMITAAHPNLYDFIFVVFLIDSSLLYICQCMPALVM